MRRAGLAQFIAVCALLALAAPLHAQLGPPTINSLNPSTVTAGASGFTLTVTGSGFVPASVVRVNGNNRATMYASANLLMATILASDISAPAALSITVFNPIATSPNGGISSNAVALQVSAAPLPTLTSAAPGFVAQGASEIRMTLVGTNFRPGATVVISPPIASVSNSTANVQAPDIAVESVQRVNGNLMVVVISLASDANVSLRAVDVVNTDGTNTGSPVGVAGAVTGSGTTQPLRISSSTSLGAPLSVVTIAMTHPRDGTLVMQGDELYGEAVLAGTGSGTVVGEWLWDDNVTEQFSVVFAGGERVTLRSQQSFPTAFLGEHTAELRITQPNQLLSKPVHVVVNPGDWKLQKILGPPYGAGFGSDAPPLLRWAPIPGAAKYQIGFSTRPYFTSIEQWHEVTDNQWQVPGEIWSGLQDGALYWTVRTIDNSDAPRKPLPMRRIMHFPAGALSSVSAAPGRTAAGNPLLSWQGLSITVFYQITVSEDSDATKLLRRYLTKDPRLDLRALNGKLVPGQTYYWQVQAILPDGLVILSGPPQSFVAPQNAQAQVAQDSRFVLVASHASRASNSRAALPRDVESLIASRSPLPDSSVTSTKPVISIQFKSPVNPADISLMVDDTDVTSLAQFADTQVSYTPALDLPSATHSVNLTLANAATSWKFTVQGPAVQPVQTAGTAGDYQQGTDAEAPPPPSTPSAAAATPPPPVNTPTPKPAGGKTEKPAAVIGPQMQTQLGSNSQWASGSAPDTNAVTFGQQMSFQDGRWRVEMNGSGILTTTFNPEAQRSSLGQVNDYVLRTSYDAGNWGANLRFGILSPALYTNSEFVTTATARQGVEMTLKTVAGSFAYFANTNDNALGGGAGVSFHQQMMGASWLAPLPKKWAEFRLMWLTAQDTGAPTTIMFNGQGQPVQTIDPVGTAGAGDAYGALLILHLTPKWQWTSEYAWSYDNPDIAMAGSHRMFGRAWRSGINGLIHKTTLSLVYRDVGPNFATPANPSLSLLSNPDRRGVDFSTSTPTLIGMFTLGYSFLESNINDAMIPEQLLHNITESWSKNITPKTIVALSSHQTLTLTGTIPSAVLALPPDQQLLVEPDQRDYGANLTVTRQVGKVSLSLGGSRDWFRNNNIAGQNVITSSILVGANWAGPQWFQLNSNLSVNWVAADKATVGGTRSVSGYLQPTFIWKRTGFQVVPLVSVNTVRTELISGMLTNDTMTGQYGGRVAWTMPGRLKFSSLSMEGELTRNRDNVTGMDFRATQLLGVWTLVWNKHLGPR